MIVIHILKTYLRMKCSDFMTKFSNIVATNFVTLPEATGKGKIQIDTTISDSSNYRIRKPYN